VPQISRRPTIESKSLLTWVPAPEEHTDDILARSEFAAKNCKVVCDAGYPLVCAKRKVRFRPWQSFMPLCCLRTLIAVFAGLALGSCSPLDALDMLVPSDGHIER